MLKAMPSLLPDTEEEEKCPKGHNGNTKAQDTTSSRAGCLASEPQGRL